MIELRADCSRCFGLCCVALPFRASADFAIDKPAGRPCPNLADTFTCRIHDRLRPAGFRGCATYECFGAGQHLSQHTFGGRDWRRHPELAASMFAALPVVRALHELLVHLNEALAWRRLPTDVHDDLTAARAATEGAAAGDPDDLGALDLDAHRHRVVPLLRRASSLVRAAQRPDHRNADLVGARLAGADLRDADLAGALLIAADLRGADLRGADVIGADLRDTDLRGADARGAHFLLAPQLDAARGDATTRLDDRHPRPAHWH